LHIPLQSGDDAVLEAMGRPYRRDRYIELIEKLVNKMPDLGVGGDVMVGFPGETEAAFQNTYDLIEQNPMVYLHVFPYSPRKGTPAVKMAGHVDSPEKKRRGAVLRALGMRKVEAFQRRFLGQTLAVLFESRRASGDGLLQGLTGNYIRVLSPGPDSARDQVIAVRLDHIEGDRVIGELLPNPSMQMLVG
jgi:threonylcarbamoyladenosine tRNA methylthiotransferase MtaB